MLATPSVAMQLIRLLGLAGAALAACNGQDAFCSRKYSNITVVGAHDSAFHGVLPADDQFVPVTQQLDYGVRFLEAQTHNKSGVIEMCHTYCWELDAGPLTMYLQEIADWLEGHPDEVVTLLLTNKDAMSMAQFDAAFEKTGLKDLVFHPDGLLSKDDWPTLQEMIDAGTRLVVFMDFHSNQSEVDYIIPEFDYFWETPYGVTDSKFPTCAVDRPSGGDPTELMGIMNHMLNYNIFGIIIPDMGAARDTNSVKSIQAQIDLCVGNYSVQPHVVLLDWVNVGEAMDAQLALNGL